MSLQNLKEYLLKRFPDAKTGSGGNEIIMRCRFCGDSQRDSSARHLYIKVSGDIPYYNCFKCNTKGVINGEILRKFLPDYTDDDIQVFQSLDSKLKIEAKQFKTTKNRNQKYNIFNTYINTNNEFTQKKLNYINKRLGLHLSYNDLLQNKIVLNLRDLLVNNNVQDVTRHPDIVDLLSTFFIGFLSHDNGCVLLRNMANKGQLPNSIDTRYVNYTIFPNKETLSMYTIPTTCDLMSLEPIHIHIAEGAFDILSIFYNLRNSNIQQNIYTAVGGKRYSTAMKLYLCDYGIMNCIFHLYPDNDVSNYDKSINTIRTVCSELNIPLYIHRNIMKGEKDFGVSLDRISESIER